MEIASKLILNCFNDHKITEYSVQGIFLRKSYMSDVVHLNICSYSQYYRIIFNPIKKLHVAISFSGLVYGTAFVKSKNLNSNR